MKAKTIVKTVLLLFVAVSLAVLVVNRGDRQPASGDRVGSLERGGGAGVDEGAGPAGATDPSRDGDGRADRVIAYYFHGNTRCRTCLSIEKYSLEAIEEGFPEAIREGRLEFRSVNLDLPANEHFVDDFRLTARTVVLERITGGRRTDFVNLDRVWELVGNREEFVSYIQDETEKFMSGES